MRVCMRVCKRACMRVYMRVCMRVYMCVCMRRVCMRVLCVRVQDKTAECTSLVTVSNIGSMSAAPGVLYPKQFSSLSECTQDSAAVSPQRTTTRPRVMQCGTNHDALPGSTAGLSGTTLDAREYWKPSSSKYFSTSVLSPSKLQRTTSVPHRTVSEHFGGALSVLRRRMLRVLK